MKTIAEKVYLFMIAMALLIGLSTTVSAKSVQGYKEIYINGMSTNRSEAEKEMRKLKQVVKREYRTRRYNPKLMYSRNSLSDAGTVQSYGRLMTNCFVLLRQGRQYGSRRLRQNCDNLFDIMALLDTAARNNHGTQITSFSRGNVISNVAMDVNKYNTYYRNGQMSRVNIGSPTEHRHGKLFTSASDMVVKSIGAISSHYPDYYYYNLNSSQKRSFKWFNYKKVEYSKKYFGNRLGHSLIECYLDRDGLDEDIGQEVARQHRAFGGR